MKFPLLHALGAGVTIASLAACSASQGPSAIVPPSQPMAAAGSPAAMSAQTSSSGDIVADAAPSSGVQYRDFGRAAANAPMQVSITLHYRHEAALADFVAQQRASNDPHWLTNAEFDQRYAPSAQTYDGVVRALRAAGLRVEKTYSNRTVIDAAGSAGNLERYFRTEIHQVEQPGFGRRFVNVRPAYAPAELHGNVLAVDGLDTLVVVRTTYARLAPNAAHRPRFAAKKPSNLFGPPSTESGSQGYAPLAFQRAYDFPSAHSTKAKTYDGSGETAAIAIDADYSDSDLAAFLSYFGIKRSGPSPKRVLIDFGPSGGLGNPDSVEATLDIETVAANAPGAAIDVYEMPELSNKNIVDTYERAISDNLAGVVSSSFGGCETLVGNTTAANFNALAEQGIAKGMTFSASTGDDGGNLCPLAPAVSPNFTAVGGTTLTVGANGIWADETAWSGSGGGISSIFGLPKWQRGFANVIARGRNTPDIALDADPATGTAFYYDGSWNSDLNPLGGTSLSSPLYAAAVAQIDQVQGGRVALDSSKLFTLAKSKGYGTRTKPYFHDITEGGNPYFAGQGYDLVTGIGSPDFWNLNGQL